MKSSTVLIVRPEPRAVVREAAAAIAAALRELTVEEGPILQALTYHRPGDARAGLGFEGFRRVMQERLAPILAAQYRESARREASGGVVRVGKASPPAEPPAPAVPVASLSFTFDAPATLADLWARENTAKLVVEVSKGTQEAITALVRTALTTGGHPYVVARQVRPLIGLHSRWATAVLRYQQRLTADPAVTLARTEELTARYYDKLLTTRSQTIARTEILDAENQGRAAAWAQAQSLGLFPQGELLKEWVASGDAEEVCAGLDGEQVPIDEDFNGDEFGDTDMPPLHPNCRCTAVLVYPSGQEGEEIG